jgi:TetR/AcrR family transcriptional regulator
MKNKKSNSNASKGRLPTNKSTVNVKARAPSRPVQQRAINTRALILNAALAEFAKRGFEAASLRRIADSINLQHPLITYHFPSKLLLWRAVAKHAFGEIQSAWDRLVPPDPNLAPIDRVRHEYRTLFRFTLEYPGFYHFMLRENRPQNPRLIWLSKNFLEPLLRGRLLPKIRAAQKTGGLPSGNPVLIHYMILGVTTVLCSLGDEIQNITGVSPRDPKLARAYWDIAESTLFRENRRSRR